MQKRFKSHTAFFVLLLLGAISVLGFAPFYLYPVSVLALVGLCYFLLTSHSIKQAALSGFAYGLGLFGVGVYWIYISLHTFGGMPSLMAGLATFLLCAFLALFPALVGIVGVYSLRLTTSHWQKILILPLLLTLSDWFRGWIFTGFPWLSIGYSQVPHSPLMGYMPILGVYGVSFITALTASILASILCQKSSRPWRRNAFISLLFLWTVGGLLKTVPWSQPIGKALSVSLLQGNIPQDLKWDPDMAVQTLHQYLTMVEASTAQLIVLPETALPVISSALPDTITSRLQQQAKKNQGAILLGIIEQERGQYFNSVLSFDGTTTETYRKTHLVPFGEFIPLKMALGWIYRDWLNMPLSDLSRGASHQQPMPIIGEKVAVNICYEDVFGEEIIRALPTATLLVNVSNDAWYGESYAAHQHLQFSQARAIETGRMMLRSTNTGATAIINPKGQIVAHAPHDTQMALKGMAQGYAGTTPYVRWGNTPIIAGCFGMLFFILGRRTRPAKEPLV